MPRAEPSSSVKRALPAKVLVRSGDAFRCKPMQTVASHQTPATCNMRMWANSTHTQAAEYQSARLDWSRHAQIRPHRPCFPESVTDARHLFPPFFPFPPPQTGVS